MLRDIVAYISEPAVIEIAGGDVRLRERSGEVRLERAMSIKTLQRHGERIKRALDRYSRGEENIVVDD